MQVLEDLNPLTLIKRLALSPSGRPHLLRDVGDYVLAPFDRQVQDRIHQRLDSLRPVLLVDHDTVKVAEGDLELIAGEGLALEGGQRLQVALKEPLLSRGEGQLAQAAQEGGQGRRMLVGQSHWGACVEILQKVLHEVLISLIKIMSVYE